MLVLVMVSCKKVEIVEQENDGFCELLPFPCETKVIQDSLRYNSVPNTFFTLSNAVIFDNCLSFDLSASGCSGDSWKVNVIDAQTIAYTNPITKNLRIEFVNNEPCMAVFSKTYFFDLRPLQQNSDTLINLYIENRGVSLLYKY